MADQKPLVQAACICERALQEPDNVVSLIRMVDSLTMKATPLATATGDAGTAGATLPAQTATLVQILDLAVAVTLKAGGLKGKFEVSIVMRPPNSEQVVTILQPSPVVFTGEDGVNVLLKFGLPFNAPPGPYWFDVLWDGELLTKIPLQLKHEEGVSKAQ